MASIFKPHGIFTITPHKVSVCILVQIYASPGEFFLPEAFSSISQHNRFGTFLLALTKSCEDILEPKLGELISRLRIFSEILDQQLTHELTTKLVSMASPDDLFNFFTELKDILGGSDAGIMEDDRISLDPSSNLGTFVRRCVLAFNQSSFEGVCHLLSNIESYSREALPGSSFHMSCLDDSNPEPEASMHYENMDMENIIYERVSEEPEPRKRSRREVPFHLHAPKALEDCLGGIDSSIDLISKHTSKSEVGVSGLHPTRDVLTRSETYESEFLRPHWQMQGYLLTRADEIEKLGSRFSFNGLESVLRKLRKLAPELHRVHFLRYLNNLYHDDYIGAEENLHRYFDYSAGMEAFDSASSQTGCPGEGRFEIALLCLGMMHFHFGHPQQALEVLAEAVRVSQQPIVRAHAAVNFQNIAWIPPPEGWMKLNTDAVRSLFVTTEVTGLLAQ